MKAEGRNKLPLVFRVHRASSLVSVHSQEALIFLRKASRSGFNSGLVEGIFSSC